MEKTIIEYGGVDYEITEPTIHLWNKLALLKDLETNEEFAITLISLTTGLDREEINKADWFSIVQASEALSEFLLNQANKFHYEFEFQDQKYRFIDLNNLTFGEFIDIDEFLRQTPLKKQTELHFLMALLYREVDENGNLTPYDASKLEDRANKFKFLSIKYLNGALVFFSILETILLKNTPLSLVRKVKWKMKKIVKTISQHFGGGIRQSIFWLEGIYLNLTRLVKRPLRKH
jgi:hypothetical protein